MFLHRQFVWVSKPYVPVMLFYSGLDRSTSLSDVHVAQLTGDAIHAWSPQPQIVVHRTEEARNLPRQANTLDVVLGQHSAEAAVCSLDILLEGD